ncbi:MAG TPA: glycosyltransferase [Candidatus Omnitrophota bacterium]|nr:glycosyltransferase [Candidatus Omnitrophota bacterium]
MTVSIIVAVKGDNPYLRECIEACLKLDYPDFEILVLPDKELNLDYPKTKVIPTGEVTPPIKRDMALDAAQGEILAFLDDDAYPLKDWLTKALSYFSDPEIAAVGGPAVTPESDDLWQKASGLVYSSWVMAGEHRYRYIPGEKREVDDYPSCNFLVRKSAMRRIGGFNTKFWPGEDTFFCLKIIRDLKKKIIYAPEALVYHHRRRLFKGHLKQIANYGLHRGYFVKRFPETSFKFTYFLPSFFVLGLFFGRVVSLLNPALIYPYFLLLSFYFISVLVFTIKGNLFQISPPLAGGVRGGGVSRVFSATWMAVAVEGFRLIFLVFWGIIISHIVYGIYFIKGILSRRLKEE